MQMRDGKERKRKKNIQEKLYFFLWSLFANLSKSLSKPLKWKDWVKILVWKLQWLFQLGFFFHNSG